MYPLYNYSKYFHNFLKLKTLIFYSISISWQKGSQNVIIHLENGHPNNETCEELDEILPSYSCSQVGTKRECNKICGIGTNGGVCQWRGSNFSGLTINYSTCSPNLNYCPDNLCDPLEEIGQKYDNFICPQDCSPSTKLFGPHTTNDNKLGIYAASGICTCDHFGKCSCAVHDTFPAKLKKSIKNKNGNDIKKGGGITTIQNSTTTTSAASGPYLSGDGLAFQCGSLCLMLTIGCPSFLIVVVIGLVISRRKYVRKAKRKHLLEHKNENNRDYPNEHDLPLVPLESDLKFEINVNLKYECEILFLKN